MSNIIKASTIGEKKMPIFEYEIELEPAQIETQESEVNEEENTIPTKTPEEIEAERIEILEEAKRQGYEEGLKQAEIEAEELKNNIIQQNNQELRGKIEQIEKEKIEYLKSIEKDVLDMIINISQKIVSENVRYNEELILNIIKTGLLKISDVEDIVIRVSEKDKGYLEENKSELDILVGQDFKYKITADTGFSEGSCIIETEFGNIDCGITTKEKSVLQSIEQIMRSEGIGK